MKESAMEDPVLEDDGYTLTRFIGAQERMHDAMRFSFRPVMPIEIAKIRDGIQGLNEQQTTLALAKVLARRITKWDARDAKTGEVLPVTADSITRKIHPMQHNRLLKIIVWCIEGGDVDPSESFSDDDVMNVPDLLDDELKN